MKLMLLVTVVPALVLAACGAGAPVSTPVPTAASVPLTPTRPPATATAPAATPTSARTPAATATSLPAATPTRPPAPAATPTSAPAPPPTPTPGFTLPSFPQAKYGGVITRRVATEPPGFDAHANRTSDVQDALRTVHDQLVQMNPANQRQIVPQLAESWSSSADGLAWTFKVRKGVLFHDGTALTARDVQYTYENVVRKPPQGVTSIYQGLLASVDSLSVPDDSTLVIRLKERSAAFLSNLGFGEMAIFSKAHVESVGRTGTERWPPMGTGPFKGKSYSRGTSMEVVRNDSYFVKGRPFLDGMKFFIVPDEGTAFAAFLTGQVLLTRELSALQAAEAKRSLGNRITVQVSPSLTWRLVQFNNIVPPFTDVRVRRAVAYAIDKAAVATAYGDLPAFGGFLAPGTGWELPEAELRTFAGYDPDRKGNLAKAKQLLADAGHPNGFTTTYFTRNSKSYVDVTVPVKAMLEDIGIKGEIKLVDSGVYFTLLMGKTDWQIGAGGVRYPGTDPNDGYTQYLLPDSGRNYANFKDPKVKDLFDKQNQEMDPAKRAELVWAMERYTLAQYPYIPLYYVTAQYAWFARIKNFSYHVSYFANTQFRDVWME